MNLGTLLSAERFPSQMKGIKSLHGEILPGPSCELAANRLRNRQGICIKQIQKNSMNIHAKFMFLQCLLWAMCNDRSGAWIATDRKDERPIDLTIWSHLRARGFLWKWQKEVTVVAVAIGTGWFRILHLQVSWLPKLPNRSASDPIVFSEDSSPVYSLPFQQFDAMLF